jgi:hypothetical protein
MAINGKPSVPNIPSVAGLTGTTYLTSSSFSQTMNSQVIQRDCKCCGRKIGFPSGDRGLCDGCEEDIPNHIPEEQYLTYMKELWRIK